MSLQVNNVSFAYSDKDVIRQLSFNVTDNELCGIVGLSGGGKTTLLKLLSGLYKPKKGQITYDGIATYQSNKRNDQLFKQIGVVFQDFQLFDHMKVLENVALPYRLKYKVNKETANKQASEILSSLGCEDVVNQYPYECSGGQKQRIAIARALILQPSILLIDEPTSALDKENTLTLIKVLQDLNKQGLTIITITHDLLFANQLCERIIEVSQGQIIKDMPREDYFLDN